MRNPTSLNRLFSAITLAAVCGSASAQAAPSRPAAISPAPPVARTVGVPAATPTPPSFFNRDPSTGQWSHTAPGGGVVSLGLQGNSVALLFNGKPFPADCVEARGNEIVYSWPKGNPIAALNISGGAVTPVIFGGTASAPQASAADDRLVVGIAISTLSDEVAEHLKVAPEEVIYVSSLTPGFGAEAAGMKARDIIISIDGRKPVSQEILREVLDSKEEGETVRLEVLRAGGSQVFDVKLRTWRGEATPPSATSSYLGGLTTAEEAISSQFLNRAMDAENAQLALDRARLVELATMRALAQAQGGRTEASQSTRELQEQIRVVQEQLKERVQATHANQIAEEARRAALTEQLALLAQRGNNDQSQAGATARLVLPPDAVSKATTDEWLRVMAHNKELASAAGEYKKVIEALTTRVEAANLERAKVTQSADGLAQRVDELTERLARLEALIAELNRKLDR